LGALDASRALTPSLGKQKATGCRALIYIKCLSAEASENSIMKQLRMFLYDDPDHWRMRAEEMRVLAEAMLTRDTKATMLRIAADYERLAEWAEQRRCMSPPA